MRRLTVDASVVLARLTQEPRPPWVDEAFEATVRGTVTLGAPSLLWIEVANRLVRRDLSDEQALDGMLRVGRLYIEPIEVGRPLLLRALQLGRDHRLTVYDATYLAAAEVTMAPLLTLDVHLARAATAMGLGRDGGPRRASEPAAGYSERPIDRASIAAIGAAIAEMRRHYSA